MRRPGEEAGELAQQGHEARDNHDFDAMTSEQQTTQCQTRRRQPDASAITTQHLVAECVADRIADELPNDRAQRCRQDDQIDVDTLCACGEQCSADQQGFARQRQADALQSDQHRERRVAIGAQQVQQEAVWD